MPTENKTATADRAEELVDDLSGVMDSRAKTYGLFARLFRTEVDQALLVEMRTMRFPTNTGNNHLDRGYDLMYRYLKNTWSDSLLDLARDYCRTFIGHGVNGHSAAYPYESVHTSEKRLLMQEARGELLAMYRANLLKKDMSWRESEDHICVELEFMSILSQRTADALRANNQDEAVRLIQTQYEFVENHLLNWVPMLHADMLHFSETELYRGLAECTLGFAQLDASVLEELLASVEQ